MADEWEQYAVQEADEWEQFAVKESVPQQSINRSGLTSSPEDFLPQELAEAKASPLQVGMSFKEYMTQAQPAFKLALEHPETLAGQAISPADIEKTTGSEYSDLYRRAGLPMSESPNMAAQLIPEIGGTALDIGTRPSAYVGAAVSKAAAPMVGALAQSSPAFRRFLELRVPTISKDVLDKYPMAPVYKEIQGIPRDITKPLPKSSPKLVQQGQKLVNAVHETMDNLGKQYGKTLEPFYKNKVENFAGLTDDTLEKIGLTPGKATVEDVWKARWDLLKKVGNPWKKEELLKKTTLSEDELTNVLTRLKASTLNSVDDKAREQILRLDPQFEDAVKAGKGLLRTVFDPETGRINTVRLTNVFKNKTDQGTQELFTRFGEYDKRVNQVAGAIKGYNRMETAKKVAGVGILGVGAEQFLCWRMRQMMSGVPGMQSQQ